MRLYETDNPGLFLGRVRVLGRQLKAQGNLTAHIEGFKFAITHAEVVEKSQPPGKIDFKPPRPVEEDFLSVRYNWDQNDSYQLLIGAKHPAIKKYLGEPTEKSYTGVNSPLYHAILAEVVAEALAFRLLSIYFKRYGQQGMLDYDSTDLYYHKRFSEFLSIAHKFLVTESQ